MDYCTIRYTPPADCPPHLAGGLRVKTTLLPAGEAVQVSPEVAGLILRGGNPGVALVDGQPAAAVEIGPVQSLEHAQANLTRAAFGAPSLPVAGTKAASKPKAGKGG